jgi:hypothetical protein
LYRVLDLNYANDKEQYFNMIEQLHLLDVSEKRKKDVATYLYMLDRKHVQIEHISYNKIKKFHWNIKCLKKYLKYGDEKLQSIVQNILA